MDKLFEVILRYDFKGGNGSFIDNIEAKSADIAFIKGYKEIRKLYNDLILTEIHIEEK